MSPLNPQPLGAFPTTHWSLVARAGSDNTESRRVALLQILNRYMPALRLHLVARKRMDEHRADDVLQGFLASKIIEQGIIQRAEKEKGKFRTFLLTALDRFLISEARKDNAQKRGAAATVAIGDDTDIAATFDQPDEHFDVAWARQLLAEAIRRMQEECRGSGRGDVWGVFQTRVLDPMLHDVPPLEYDDLVKKFGLTSPTQASNLLVTGKRTFARILRSLVAEYAKEDADIDQEIADLTSILSKARD
jgi:RNA polymerase sigma-70 factor (ECF subfamily)